MDEQGKIVIEPKYDNGAVFSEGLAAININGKSGYINKTGTIVIKPQFDEGCSFSDGLAAIRIGNKWGYIDKNGKEIISPQYYELSNFYNGVAKVNTSSKEEIIVDGEWESWAYINKKGKIIWKSSN